MKYNKFLLCGSALSLLAACGGPNSSEIPSSSEALSSSSSSSSSENLSSSQTPSQEEVDRLMDLIAKQDLSPIYDKMFVSQFIQDYEAYTSNTGVGNEAETSFYTYHGAGLFGCLYEVSQEAYAEAHSLDSPDFFDYLVRGKGSYGMIQQGSLVSYHHEIEEEETSSSLQSLEFVQQLDARFSEESVQIVNFLGTKTTIGEGGYNVDEIQSFNGIIDKGLLFDTITVSAFSDIFARTNLFDGQRSCETLDRIYFETLRELSLKSKAELSEFIANNDIHIEEDEENTLVHFKIGDEQLRTTLGENDIMPGDFEGTLTYEKESGKFNAYDYKIVYKTNELDVDSGHIHSASMEFKASGYSWNQKYGEEPYIDPNPTVYDDAEAFLDDVIEEVIPPVF